MHIQNAENTVATKNTRPVVSKKLIGLLSSSFFVAGVLLATFLIYLTPLKWYNLIEPTIHDVLPALFYQELQENPKGIIFIDVRSKSAYDKEHAVGAISMPLHTLYSERKLLPKMGKKIVIMCTGASASGVGYSYLEHYGFQNLRRIEGGIVAWKEAGLPTVVGIPQGP